ncbi:hypothetical protein quinque_000139 [Culex quinquefasciatus]
MDSFTQMGRVKFTPVDPVDEGQEDFFKDVACLQETKQEMMKFVELKASDRLGQRFLNLLYLWVHLSVLAKVVAIQALLQSISILHGEVLNVTTESVDLKSVVVESSK